MDIWEGYLFLFRSYSGQYIDLYVTLDFTLKFNMKPEEPLIMISCDSSLRDCFFLTGFLHKEVPLVIIIGFRMVSTLLTSHDGHSQVLVLILYSF